MVGSIAVVYIELNLFTRIKSIPIIKDLKARKKRKINSSRMHVLIDVFHKWRLWHGNEARMLFSRSILVSNYQTDMISFLAFFLLSIRVSFEG